MNKPSDTDIEIAKAFKQGASMLDLALEYGTTYPVIQAMIRRVMIDEGDYSR
jgi:hypothetical protein